jgi:hypothetical protein
VKKKQHRFGMDYFGGRHVWVKTSGFVIRDTHREWKVQDLYELYIAPKNKVEEETNV